MAKKHTTEVISQTPLLLLESEGGSAGPFNEDGTVNVVVLRPGRAQGRGRRVYSRDMLRESADTFKGWPVFDNHESPAARRARAGIPRPTSELRGEIRETWWDDTFTHPDDPADLEPGGVMGRMSPTRDMRELIESCPNLVRLSVKAYATGLRSGTYRGQPAEIVEGIDREDVGSVDAVTNAGAGGRVLALMESGYDRDHGDAERALEDLDDEELRHHLRNHRPHLLEAAAPGGGGVEEPVPESADKNKRVLTLQEVFASDEFEERVIGLVGSEVATRLDSERELTESRITARYDRQIEVRDLCVEAHRLIQESKLPPVFADDLRLRYRLIEESDGRVRPSAALDIQPERDGDAVTKPAKLVLQESLGEDIKRERRKLQESAGGRTRVTGQGAAGTGDGEPSKAGSGRQQRGGGFADGLRRSGVDTDRLAGSTGGEAA